jgi:hypothetical protein
LNGLLVECKHFRIKPHCYETYIGICTLQPYIQLEDYSPLTDATLDGRKYHIDYLIGTEA